MPVGHQTYNYSQSAVDFKKAVALRGEKIFFMKARVMAGQVDLTDNSMISDFQWLTKEEIQQHITPRDFAAVKNLLADR